MYATDSQGTATLHNIYTDGLGTPRAVTGAGGKITLWIWPARQNPFGERAAVGMPDTLNLRFPGQYYADGRGCTTTTSGTTRRGWGGISKVIRLDRQQALARMAIFASNL